MTTSLYAYTIDAEGYEFKGVRKLYRASLNSSVDHGTENPAPFYVHADAFVDNNIEYAGLAAAAQTATEDAGAYLLDTGIDPNNDDPLEVGAALKHVLLTYLILVPNLLILDLTWGYIKWEIPPSVYAVTPDIRPLDKDTKAK